MKKYVSAIVIVLFFGYLGFTSNHDHSSFYTEAVPDLAKESSNYSLVFIALMILLLGSYFLRKNLDKITGPNKTKDKKESNLDDSIESNQIDNSESKDVNSNDSELSKQNVNEENPNDSEDFIKSIEDTYK